MLHRFVTSSESFRPARLAFRELSESSASSAEPVAESLPVELELDHPAEVARMEREFRTMLDRLLQSGIPLEKGLLPAHARLAGDPQMLQQRLIPEVLQIVFANRAEVAAALVAFSQRIWDENVAADLADLADQPQLTGLDQKLLSIGLEAARRLEETPETPSRFFHLGAEAKEIRVAARTDLFANIISSQFIVTGSAEDRDAMKRCRPEPTA